MTLQQRDRLLMFSADLSWLDAYRAGADRAGTTYQQKLQQILAKNQSSFDTSELKDAAAEFLLLEQFKQQMFETIGLDSREAFEFQRVQREIEFFSGAGASELDSAVQGLTKKIHQWADQRQNASPSDRLRVAAQAENMLTSLKIVSGMMSHTLKSETQNLYDRLNAYRQYLYTALGGSAVVGTLVVSAPIVTTASASAGVAGVLLAGCSLGATGGAAASLLQSQYSSYSTAWIESSRNQTSYSCELRRAAESTRQNLWHSLTEGGGHGAIAGCVFTGAGMIAPKVTVYTVTSAVALATGIETMMSTKDGLLATRSYLIYKSLQSMQQAEALADQPARAQEALHNAQIYAQRSGAHALNAVLVGIVLVGGPSEIRHALGEGRQAIIALIGKSSDNAAVAVNQLGSLAQKFR